MTVDPTDQASVNRVAGALDANWSGGIRALIAAVTEADDQAPLNEEARLSLDQGAAVHLLLGTPASPRGYAQHHPSTRTGQLLIHPHHRRAGLGSALLAALRHEGASAVWAFGNLPAAQGFAAHHGLTSERGLLVMARSLTSSDTAPDPAPGITLRGFDPQRDTEDFLAVNAAAFAGHPEQGQFDRHDLDARIAEPWFDPDGLILAHDAEGLIGFHWTKRHDEATGEVYVVGVNPRAQGTGLGRVLLAAGLARLRAVGCRRVILYVDLGNPRAVELYRSDGFEVITSDLSYGLPGISEP